jgi:hypothetical protein
MRPIWISPEPEAADTAAKIHRRNMTEEREKTETATIASAPSPTPSSRR